MDFKGILNLYGQFNVRWCSIYILIRIWPSSKTGSGSDCSTTGSWAMICSVSSSTELLQEIRPKVLNSKSISALFLRQKRVANTVAKKSLRCTLAFSSAIWYYSINIFNVEQSFRLTLDARKNLCNKKFKQPLDVSYFFLQYNNIIRYRFHFCRLN